MANLLNADKYVIIIVAYCRVIDMKYVLRIRENVLAEGEDEK
jgi:hypothetical protein